MNDTTRKPRRFLRWIVITLVSIAVFYLGLANIALNTSLISSLVSKRPEKTLIEWSSARTFWPGSLHIEDLRVRAQSKGQQWQIRVDEADVELSLLALFSKAVRIRHARGTHLDFRLRPRLTEETKDDPNAVHYPEIEGLSNPPDPTPEDIDPPKKKDTPGWHLDFADVEFEGPTSVWINGAQMRGEGLVAAEMDYLLRREFHMPRAVFALEQGVIALGANPVLGDLDIEVDMTLGPFDPKSVKGLDVLDHLLGSSRLNDGEIKDLSVLNAYVPGAGTLKITGGSVSFNWALDKPSVEAGASGVLSMAATGADMRLAGRDVSGDVDLQANLVRGSLKEGRWEVADTTLALDNMEIDILGGKKRNKKVDPGVDEDDLWWGHFAVTSGVVDIGDPGNLKIDASFRIKNTDPLVHLFLAKPNEAGDTAKVPGWVRFIPDIQDLGGTANLRMDESGALLDNVVVQGDKFALAAQIHTEGEDSDGVLYVRYRGLDAGLEMIDGKSDIKILRPRKWFLEQIGPENERMRAVVEN